MSRKFMMGIVLLVGTCVTGTASAQSEFNEWNGYSQPGYAQKESHGSFHYDFHRNNRWPLPFRGMDTSSVVSHFEVQRNNGWKLHNTLGTAMFQPETQALTDAGRNHTKWIISQAPHSRRVVFVLAGNNPQETAARVEATQVAISEMIPVGPLPSIYLTDRDAPGSSGVYQDAINRAIVGSVPAPRLTPNSAP